MNKKFTLRCFEFTMIIVIGKRVKHMCIYEFVLPVVLLVCPDYIAVDSREMQASSL